MAYVVNQEYQTNQLSHIPGGTDVTVKLTGCEAAVYSRIKNPKSYVDRVISNHDDIDYIKVFIDDEWILIYEND